METYQLKRIIIIVLVLVNLSLLALLGRNAQQEYSARQQTLMQLKDLYLFSGIELELDELPSNTMPNRATVLLSPESEVAFAEAFLGPSDVQSSGSAMLYSSELGAMRLRRNGAFELNMYGTDLTEETCLRLLEELGYTAFFHRSSEGTVSATQTLDDVPVIGSTVTLHFSGDHLISANGFYVAALQEEFGTVSDRGAADALTAFLQHKPVQEPAYSSIRRISPARQLSAETLFQSTLLPAWIIETNQGLYYVNQDGSEIVLLQSDIS